MQFKVRLFEVVEGVGKDGRPAAPREVVCKAVDAPSADQAKVRLQQELVDAGRVVRSVSFGTDGGLVAYVYPRRG